MPKPTDGREKVREQEQQRQGRGTLTPSYRGGALSRGGGWPLARMRSEFDRLFDDFFRGWGLPAVAEERQSSWGLDVDDQGDKVVVRAEAPGFEPDEFDVQVPAGRMTVEARIDWTRSAPLEIDAAEGQTVELEVANDWSPMLAIWAVTFGAYSYLTLRRKDGPSPV